MRRILALAVILSTACSKTDAPTSTDSKSQADVAAAACTADLSKDKSQYFETAQRLGADFSKLAKLPISVGLENQVKDVVADTYQAIPDSDVRCAMATKLVACAINLENLELAASMKDSMDKVCAPEATAAEKAEVEAKRAMAEAAKAERIKIWNCIPPGRRGAVTNFEISEPTRTQIGEGLLFMSGESGAYPLVCVDTLAKAGADPNYTAEVGAESELDFGSGPPLHYAISQRRWDVVAKLVEVGANPQRRSLYRGISAIQMAAE